MSIAGLFLSLHRDHVAGSCRPATEPAFELELASGEVEAHETQLATLQHGSCVAVLYPVGDGLQRLLTSLSMRWRLAVDERALKALGFESLGTFSIFPSMSRPTFVVSLGGAGARYAAANLLGRPSGVRDALIRVATLAAGFDPRAGALVQIWRRA